MTLPYGLNFCDKELDLAFLRIETSHSVDKKLICTIYYMSNRVISASINNYANQPRFQGPFLAWQLRKLPWDWPARS